MDVRLHDDAPHMPQHETKKASSYELAFLLGTRRHSLD